MTMQELEQDIVNDLQELGDTISQYTFLIACAGECPPFPEEFRTEEHLVRECQVKTWIHAEMIDDKVSFLLDSEALIIKGALSLIREIYQGRAVKEVQSYHCTLTEHEEFTKHLTREQLEGVKAIIKELSTL